MRRRWAALALVAITGANLFAGYLLKKPCADGPGWAGGGQYARLCYNDLQALYSERKLDERRFPYVEERSYEYPAGIAVPMWAASLFSRSFVGYYYSNLPLLLAAALLALAGLVGAVGPTPAVLAYAAGTPLLLYATFNWDLLAVAPLCLAMWAWSRRRDGLAGLALGWGAAAKLFPGFVVPALALAKIREARLASRRAGARGPEPAPRVAGADLLAGGAGRLALGAAAAWLAWNLPLIAADWIANGAPDGWIGAFAFHSRRLPDFGTVWYWLAEDLRASPTAVRSLAWAPVAVPALGAAAGGVVARRARPGSALAGDGRRIAPVCGGVAALSLGLALLPATRAGPGSVEYKQLVDRASFLLFAGGSLWLWTHAWRAGRDPWAIGGATVVLFLLVSKVHSPQYALWVVPFLVLVETPAWMIVLYYAADALVFWTNFEWFARAPHLGANAWQVAFAYAVHARHVALAILFGWFALRGRARAVQPPGRPAAALRAG